MSTRGTLTFLAKKSPPPVYQASVGGKNARLELVGNYEQRLMHISDGRKMKETFTLDHHGFQLLNHATTMKDFYDSNLRKIIYETECKKIVQTATGAEDTFVFDHTLRSGDEELRKQKLSREPTTVIHNDYTPRSAKKRLQDFMGSNAQKFIQKPFAIVNLWRPIKKIESFPIAVCDANSVSPKNLIRAERRAKDRIGEIFVAHFNPKQRWVYFPDMSPEEVLLIKTYDSREDGRARWCIHTAVDIENTPESAAPRESIESRIFAFGV